MQARCRDWGVREEDLAAIEDDHQDQCDGKQASFLLCASWMPSDLREIRRVVVPGLLVIKRHQKPFLTAAHLQKQLISELEDLWNEETDHAINMFVN